METPSRLRSVAHHLEMYQFDKVAAHQALELVIRTVSRLEIGAERHNGRPAQASD